MFLIYEDRDFGATRSDGPFVQSKEQVGGYHLIEAKDENRVPSVKWGHGRAPSRVPRDWHHTCQVTVNFHA
jgi:hypothetical protein